MNFLYSLSGPTDLIGKYSNNKSLDIISDNASSFYFNTDSLENYQIELTMIITDLQGNYYMTINFLDNRIANKELFGFKSHLNDTMHLGTFARGTYGVVLCSFSILNN